MALLEGDLLEEEQPMVYESTFAYQMRIASIGIE